MAVARQANPHGALVELVGNPLDEAARFAPPDQFDSAVVPQQKMVGDVSDRRTTKVIVSPYHEQELVL